MSDSPTEITMLRGVRVPRSLLERPFGFGGQACDDCILCDLMIKQGTTVALRPPSADTGRLILPRLTEPHVHLDKCHTVDRIEDVGGDLTAAIQAQWQDKANWTDADIRKRARRGLRELQQAGVGVLRTHVDWGPMPEGAEVPLAWGVIGELAQEFPGMTVQRAALIGIAQLTESEFAKRTAKGLAADDGVLGSFVFGQPERADGIEAALALADTFGLSLDFHVDEGLDPTLDGVEMIADAALRHNHQGPILLGHACALTNLADDAFKRVAQKLARAKIAVTALPSTNLYLQGRSGTDPVPRGLTRIQALLAEGVTVALGTDNVRDAFCPIGRHDPRQTLALGILAAHLDPPLGKHLAMISTDALAALGLAPIFVDRAPATDLLVFEAASTSDLLSDLSAPKPLKDLLLSEHP